MVGGVLTILLDIGSNISIHHRSESGTDIRAGAPLPGARHQEADLDAEALRVGRGTWRRCP
eukprot:6556417-Pyramimonas_sp.AAC.2